MAVVSATYGLAFFPVPKNACTTGKEWIHYLETGAFFGKRPRADGFTVRVHGVAGFATSPLAESDLDQTATFFRFAILRDPVERLISAYNDKAFRGGGLGPRFVSPAQLQETGLPQRPDFATFVEHLDAYRSLSWTVAHHTDPQVVFLGRNPSAFDRLAMLQEIGQLRADISARVGRDLPELHSNSSRKIPTPVPTAGQRRRIEAFYAEDYAVFGTQFGRVSAASA